MNRIYLVIIVSMLCISTLVAKGRKEVVILHTNDTHSSIMPLKEALPDSMLAGRGGFLRRIAMLREEREKHPNLLLFDSGDYSQGSSYYTMFKGEVEVGLMNQMGYDAVTIGNHEFDFGLENMARLFRMANFPIVCSNYDVEGSPLEGLVKPYITLMRDGVKIGVFAVCPPMKGLVATKNYGKLKYLDPAVTAQKYIDILRRKEQCDVVICLSHLGWKETEPHDEQIISKIEGCDLVLGGHSHTYMEEMEYAPDKTGKLVPDNQNGKHAVFVGRLVLRLE
jgi:5'-nucleotidase